MQAIILCGGRGERLMPMTAMSPSGLLRLAGKEVILYILDELKLAGFTKCTLALGYLGYKFREFFEENNYNGVNIQFSQDIEDGTADAILKCINDEDLLIIEANAIHSYDLAKAIKFYHQRKTNCLIVRKTTANNSLCFIGDNSVIMDSIKIWAGKLCRLIHEFQRTLSCQMEKNVY